MGEETGVVESNYNHCHCMEGLKPNDHESDLCQDGPWALCVMIIANKNYFCWWWWSYCSGTYVIFTVPMFISMLVPISMWIQHALKVTATNKMIKKL